MNAPTAQTVKFKVDRDVFTDAVTWTTKYIPQRPAVPVLTGLLITAHSDGSVDLAVFDYEVSARANITADVEAAGTVLVSGRLLSEIARALPPQPVTFELDGQKVNLSCGSSRFALMTMPVEEFPELPAVPETTGVIDSGEFQNAVSQVNAATLKDETLPILTAMRMEIEGDRVTLLATDRYRLAVREFTWNPRNPTIETAALVRGKTLVEAAKAMSGDIEIGLAESGGKEMISFSSEGRVTTSLLMGGDYPKVRSLFPKEVTITAVLETSALREAVRRVALVAERNSAVKFEFTDGSLILHAGAGDDAQATEALPATIDGEDILTGFNPVFISEGLAQIETPFVRFSMTEPKKPVVIAGSTTADGDDDGSYRYLLMPILRF